MNKIHQYGSGMRLAFHRITSTRSVAIGIYVHCGSGHESAGQNGISHVIEHMLFKGTAKRSAYRIADETESAGVQINAFTSKDVTSYYTISTDEHVELCIDVLSDLFFHAALDEDQLEREKGVILEEIKMGEDDPEDVCYDQLSFAYYGDTGLGRPIIGTEENVKSFTSEGLRSFMQEHYTPENTVISVAGDVDYKTIKELIEKYFESEWDNRKGTEKSATYAITPKSLRKTKPVEQANVAFAFPAYEYGNKKGVALSLLSNVLGGGMSSRLFHKVREELGLAYEIYSVPSDHAEIGYFSVFFAANPKSVARAVGAVKEVLEEIIQNGITEREFSKGKEQLKAGIVLGAERTVSVMRAMGRSVILKGLPFDVDQRLAEVDAVTMDDVNEVIKEVLKTDKAAASYVGKEIKDDPLQLLQTKTEKKKKA